MRLKSLLFVPASDERKLRKALASEAEGVVLDLEDSVLEDNRPHAREAVKGFLRDAHGKRPQVFVRINRLGTRAALYDAAAAVAGGADGLVLPKADGIDDVRHLGWLLDGLEAMAERPVGATRIIVVLTETARSVLNMASYAAGHPRLAAVTWGAEDLSACLGAVSKYEANASLGHIYAHARAQCLLVAAATGVPAIDTAYIDFRDEAGLASDCQASFHAGFSGRLAIHPAQIPIIHRCYRPTAEQVADALKVVRAFAECPGAGAVSIDGRMYDRPHLAQAQRILDLAEAGSGRGAAGMEAPV